MEHRPLFPPTHWSPEYVDFVNECLVKDVKERPSVNELMDVRRGRRK